jgi:hypothetical protein
MADFYGCLSSTSFRVKDREAFLADPEVKFIKDWARGNCGFFVSDDDSGFFAFGWEGNYPNCIDPPSDEDLYQDPVDSSSYLAGIIQRHILPGDVCQIGISGREKFRFIGGTITWVTSKGSVCFDGFTGYRDKHDSDSLKDEVEKLSTGVASIV